MQTAEQVGRPDEYRGHANQTQYPAGEEGEAGGPRPGRV